MSNIISTILSVNWWVMAPLLIWLLPVPFFYGDARKMMDDAKENPAAAELNAIEKNLLSFWVGLVWPWCLYLGFKEYVRQHK